MRIKKILACLVVILLVVKSPIIAYAESATGTVTVSGGSIGSGGVEGNSNILKQSALTVLMTTLTSAGIQIKVAADDYAHGTGAFAYLENKFNEWEQTSSDAWDSYNSYRAMNETKVDEQGNLYIPEVASAVMQKFVNWLYASENISDIPVADTEGVDGTFFGNKYIISSNKYIQALNNADVNIACVQDGIGSSTYYSFAFSRQEFSYKFYINGGATTAHSSSNSVINGWHYAMIYSYSYKLTSGECKGLYNISTKNYYGKSGIASYLRGATESNPVPLFNTGFYGNTLDIPQLVDESGNGKIIIVQPGLIGSVQDAYTGSNNASINLQDYLDALRDLYGLQALPQDITDLPGITLTGEDAITGTKEQVAVIDREVVLNPDITLPADDTAITWPEVPSIAIPVSDPSVPADPDVSIPAMSIDLTQYFPFCLPFDIYHILQKLNADPVTPELTVDWGNILGQFGIEYEMHIDFHDYDDLAALLRNMETAAFVVGLAVVTRQMFLRG